MEEKKKIIIQEILYWHKNHLLPEHYCQFLLNLYREGEGDERQNSSSRRKRGSWKLGIISLLISFVLLGLFFVVINFRSLSIFIQGGILFAFSLVLYGITAWIKWRKSDIHHLTLGVSSLSLLFTSLWIGRDLELEAFALFLSLVLVLAIWMLSGILFQANYIVFISIVGFMIAYGWYMHPWIISKQSVLHQHLVWYPVALVGIVVGVFLLKKEISISKIIFFSGITAVIVPVVHTFFLEQTVPMGQLLFFLLEIIFSVVILFFTRTLWLK